MRTTGMAGMLLALLAASISAGLSAVEAAMPEQVFRDTNTHHEFRPPASKRQWEARAQDLRMQILVSAGLWPMPPRTPLRPIVTGRIDEADYTVENVAIETMPGFYLCGSVYRPKGMKGPFPAVANPHGHQQVGRIHIAPDEPIAAPPPAKPAPGRGNLVAIGVNLARQGYVVFAYDMIGYNDTSQTPDHRQFANNPECWQWGISAMGLQLWNSIRAVDYLCSLPEVDPARIGATGGSGGGSQTFLLTAVDGRIGAAVPVNMVSSYMQGGCLCENAPALRIGTDNAEIAACAAPRPLSLVSATGDWTSHVPEEEGPAVGQVYEMLGAAEKAEWPQFNYGHNYNIESRETMYAWFGRWLKGDPNREHFREKPFVLDPQRLRVWTESHPRPEHALTEPGIISAMKARRTKAMADAAPKDASDLAQYREAMTPALAVCLGMARNELPAVRAAGRRAGRPSGAVIVFAEDAAAQAREARELRELLTARGVEAVEVALPPLDDDPSKAWGEFYTCYNQTALGKAAAVAVRQIRAASARSGEAPAIVGLGRGGLPALLAASLTASETRVAVDWGRFDPSSDRDYQERLWAPCIRGMEGPETAIRILAGSDLWLSNTGGWSLAGAGRLFEACGGSLKQSAEQASVEQIAGWLSRPRPFQ